MLFTISPASETILRPLSGLGSLGMTASQDISYAGQATAIGASVGITAAASAGLIAAGTAAMAVPIVGPIIGGIALALNAFGVGQGCGSTCIYASNCANAVSDAASKNMNAYFAVPNGQRTPDMQTQALANFDAMWGDLQQCCSNQGAGTGAGQRCISERQRGGKYDYFKMFRDPIANDAVVNSKKASIAAGANAGTSITAIAEGTVNKVLGGGGSTVVGSTAGGGGGGISTAAGISTGEMLAIGAGIILLIGIVK